MSLQTTASTLKIQGVISKSSEIMTAMNQLVKLPELQESMTAMSREMMRAGLIEEMISDTMDAMDTEGLEGEADKEVDKIITELTAGILGEASAAPTSKIAGGTTATSTAAAVDVEALISAEAEEQELKAMQQRLQSL